MLKIKNEIIKKEIDFLNSQIDFLKNEIKEEKKIKNPSKEDFYELGKLEGKLSIIYERKVSLALIDQYVEEKDQKKKNKW